MPNRVLIIDDDPDLAALLEVGLDSHGFEVVSEQDPVRGLDRLRESDFDVVLVDVRMPGMSGLELCERAALVRAHVPVLVMTAFASLETAVEAMRAGAYDYLEKPLSPDAVALRLLRVIEANALRAEVARLRKVAERASGFEDLIGDSAAMRSLYDKLTRIADSAASVLVTGESGTGKEVVARSLHRRGSGHDGPFIPINCAAIPAHLMESELFGHERGAFTDAHASRPGLFTQANGGTLFLDEVGELPLELQPKLLRALEERKVRPVGGKEEIAIDFRLISATNRDLEEAVESGRFREDLYYRINVIHLELPPLRARGRDVLVLAQRFLDGEAATANKRIDSFSAPAAERLLAYPWPGNVRELRNAMEHAVALARTDEILVEDLPARVQTYQPSHVLVSSATPDELVSLEEVERRYTLHVLASLDGNKSAAAKVLGVDRKTLYRKLDRWSAEREDV